MMGADAQKVQKELELQYISEVTGVDNYARKVYEEDVWKARDFLTEYSVKTAANTFKKWKSLSEYLLVKYIDGNIKKEKDGRFATTPTGYPEMPMQPGYPDSWKKSVIRDTGTKLLMPAGSGH